MEKEVKICDECESSYYANSSLMESLCPNCSHFLYDYDNCAHQFEDNRCILCFWDGSITEFIRSKMNSNNGS